MRTKIAASLAAAALVAGGFIAPTAFADDAPNPDASAALAATIDTSQTVELKIHKYLGASTGIAADGTDKSVAAASYGDALNGVNFKVYKVQGVNLTTNTGWEAAKTLIGKETATNAEIEAKSITAGGSAYTLGDPQTVITANDGTATFTQTINGVGLYLVQEDVNGSTSITKANGVTAVEKTAVTPSAPFFVTLPMTEPTGNSEWMYTVHVYPKNQEDTLTKKVDDSQAYGPEAQSKTIKYYLDGDITDTGDTNGDSMVKGADLGYWMLQDQLVVDVFDMDSVQVEAKIGTERASAITLTPCATVVSPTTCDYAVKVDNDSGLVTIVLTEQGLNTAATQNNSEPSTKIFVTLSADLKSDTTTLGSGALTNTGYLFPNGKWVTDGSSDPKTPTPPTYDNFMPPTPTDPNDPDNETPGIPSESVSSTYGTIVVRKTDKDFTSNLSGAAFSLYTSGDDTNCDRTDITDTNKIADATPDTTNPGLYTFNHILLSTSYTSVNENGTVTTHTTAKAGHVYCIVETVAPEGYELLAEPVQFELKKGAETVDPVSVAAALTSESRVSENGIAIVNLPTNLGNRLPFTGAQGIWFAAIAGGVLLIGGIGLGIRNRRAEV